MKTLTASLSGFWSTIRKPLLITSFVLIVFLALLSRIDRVDDRLSFEADLATAQSAARAWAGVNCARPPSEQMGLADVLREVGWSDGLYDAGAWSIRLTTGPDGTCTGAMILYSGHLVDSTDSTTRRLLRSQCASRQNTGILGFPVRPAVITGSDGEYQLRWDAGAHPSC